MKMTLLLLALAIGFNASAGPAEPLPASAEQLRHEFESALAAKDTNAITALICWKGVSDLDKAGVMREAAEIVKHEVTGVTLAAWPTNYPKTYEVKGIRYKPNLDILGMVTVKFADQRGAVGARMPYGKNGDVFLMAATVEEPVTAPAGK